MIRITPEVADLVVKIIIFFGGVIVGLVLKTGSDVKYDIEIRKAVDKMLKDSEAMCDRKNAEIKRLHTALRDEQLKNIELRRKLQ